MRRTRTDGATVGLSCTCLVLLVWVIGGMTIGAVCSNHSLDFLFGVQAPWYADAAIGAVGGGFVITVGVVTWACDLGGVKGPVWPMTDEAKARKGLTPAEAPAS